MIVLESSARKKNSYTLRSLIVITLAGAVSFMTSRLSKTVIATLLSSLLLTGPISAGAETQGLLPAQDLLPDIGTSAGATLSIDQEMAMGTFMSAKCAPAHH